MDLVTARREHTRRLPRIRRQDSDFFGFDGGLNLLDSPMSVKPGELSGGLNYEVDVQGGYRRIGGYEAYDGSPSTSEATYWKLLHGKDGTDGRTIERAINDTISGQLSGASGAWLAATEEGGYGINEVINNEAFSNADWDETNLTPADDVIAATADTPAMSLLTDSVDGSPASHYIETAVGNVIAVSEGEVVYVTAYIRAGSADRISIDLFDYAAADVWGSGLVPGIGYRADTGAIVSTSAGAAEFLAGELISNGIYRVWFRTDMANASGNVKVRVRQLEPGGTATSYIGAGDTVYCGGVQVVPAPLASVHNLVPGRIFAGNTYWSATSATLTPADADVGGAIANHFADATKLTDAGAGGTTHTIRSTYIGNTAPVKVKAGDRLHIQWVGKYVSGQIQMQWIDGHALDNGVFSGALFAVFNIVTGSLGVTFQGAGISQAQITALGTDEFKVEILSNPVTVDTEFSLRLGHAIPDVTFDYQTSYTSSGLYSYLTGFQAVARPDSLSQLTIGSGDITKHGYVKTTTAAKNVSTGSIILGGVTGLFQADEDLQYAAADWAQARTVATEGGETDTALDADYTVLAVANASPAAAPAGSGPVRGVWEYNGVTYCFRNNTGGTAGQMFKETGSGWTLIALNERLSFDTGDDAIIPVIGDTLTGAGGASAPIRRVVQTSGTWGVDAAGYFILGTVTAGPFVNNEQLQVSAADVALADGVNAVQTLPAGGRYEFRNNNFYGASDMYRMYGVNGVGLGFEYDDDPSTGFFCEIETGMAVDTPNHLATHNFHLFYSFPGGSIQLSGDGDPVSWTVITGASEIAIGTDCTGFNEEVGNSLFIFGRNRSWVLQGNTRANFDLDDFNINAGAHEWSVDRIGLGCYFDDRGFTTLLQQQRSGSTNFEENAISTLIQPMISDLLSNTSVRAAHLVKNRNIYRCYFADGRVVSIAFRDNKAAGHTVLEYPFSTYCAVSGEDTTGAEVVFIGADDGFVYKLETGTSFNGAPLRAFMRTVLYDSKGPGRFKKYSHGRLDAQLFGALTMRGRIEFDFHDDGFNLGDELDFTTDEAGGYWDDFAFDNFSWDKSTSGIPQQKLEGEGVNAAVYLHTESTSDPVHILRGLSLQWLPRRDDRRTAP